MYTQKVISLIIFLFCATFGIISVIKRRKALNSLSEDDKAILKDCKAKVQKQKRKIDIIRNILIVILIAIIIYFAVMLLQTYISYKSIKNDPIKGVIISTDRIINTLYSAFSIYAIIYSIIESVTYALFTRSIFTSKELADKQKNLLKLYYNNRAILFILFAILIITLSIMLEPSGCF